MLPLEPLAMYNLQADGKDLGKIIFYMKICVR